MSAIYVEQMYASTYHLTLILNLKLYSILILTAPRLIMVSIVKMAAIMANLTFVFLELKFGIPLKTH